MEMVTRDTTASGADQNVRERSLIAIVGELARELHPQHVRPDTISLSSRLERDLGIDSLGRTELVLRLERAFGVRLSISLVGEANSVGDLWQALEQAGQTRTTIAAAPAPASLGAVSAAAEASTHTRWAGSRKPCSRIQRRRARATSARFRSAARRLFFNGDPMASEESGQRAAAAWDSPLVKRRNDLIQREVRYLADEGENLPRVLLQWRTTPSTAHGFESSVFTKALHPPDRRTDADIKLFGRLPSGSSFLHEVDDARSQLTRIRSMHWAALRRINALDSHLRRVLGIPILLEVLEWHVAHDPDRLHLAVLEDDSTILGTLSYAELAKQSRSVAAGLVERDIMPGDRVALMLPTGLDFFTTFFGVLYAGGIPVPIYPPMQRSQIEDYARRQAGILRNAGARLLVTVPEGIRLGAILKGLVPSLSSIESAMTLSGLSTDIPLPILRDGSATALIQYTSGSTGDPKGVVLSHANLLANIRGIGRAVAASSADIFVSWLPLYHDMGLIGAWLGCLYYGAPLYAMSPLAFLARPQSWLWAIHRFRGTISAAPNFAFELCLSKIDDSDLKGLDLSSLRLVGNGAEPVSVDTLRRFIDRFAAYGFRSGAMAPVYGLAENAVAVTLPPPGRPPIIDRVDRAALSTRGIAEPATLG